MKLVQKLTLAFVAASVLIFAANGLLRINREVGMLRAGHEADDRLMARSLSSAISAAWRAGGRDEALRIVDGANETHGRVHARFIDGMGPPDGSSVIDGTRLTYVTIAPYGTPVGDLEISDSLESERAATSQIILNTVSLSLSLAAVSILVAAILGYWLVGKPVRLLADKARRIGSGDFSGKLVLHRRDEMGQLADELNATCDKLVEANARVENETAARIATLQQLRHADRLATVGKLASGLAHELGTPLNVVLARAQMIAETSAEPDTRNYADIITKATTRMTDIIGKLMAFARRKTTKKAVHDMKTVTQETLTLLKPLADKANVYVELRCERAAALECEVDRGEIQQAITNLVVNAIQAGGDSVVVSIERAKEHPPNSESEKECVCLRVRDRGGGIAPEHLHRVFEPFFTTKDIGQGTGLGLAVTHGIVEDHGGWLRVESKPREGSVFSMFLPSA